MIQIISQRNSFKVLILAFVIFCCKDQIALWLWNQPSIYNSSALLKPHFYKKQMMWQLLPGQEMMKRCVIKKSKPLSNMSSWFKNLEYSFLCVCFFFKKNSRMLSCESLEESLYTFATLYVFCENKALGAFCFPVHIQLALLWMEKSNVTDNSTAVQPRY